jgi:hypothetical protein
MGSEPFVGCLWLWFMPVKASCIFHATLSNCFFLSFLLKSWSNSTSVCWFQWQNLDASRHWYWKASGFKESYINRFALSTLYYDAFFDINRFAYDIVHIFWWGQGSCCLEWKGSSIAAACNSNLQHLSRMAVMRCLHNKHLQGLFVQSCLCFYCVLVQETLSLDHTWETFAHSILYNSCFIAAEKVRWELFVSFCVWEMAFYWSSNSTNCSVENNYKVISGSGYDISF